MPRKDPVLLGYRESDQVWCEACSPSNEYAAIWSDDDLTGAECSTCGEPLRAPVKHGRRCVCPECVEAYLEDQRDGARGEERQRHPHDGSRGEV